MISALDARALRGSRASRDRLGRPRGPRLEKALHSGRELSRPRGRSPLPPTRTRSLSREQTLPFPRWARALVLDFQRDSGVSKPEVGGRARWVLGRHPSASGSAEFSSARKAAAETRGTSPGCWGQSGPCPNWQLDLAPTPTSPMRESRAGRSQH